MNRENALKLAVEHVNALGTSQGFRDTRGVNGPAAFADRVAAVDRFARFLAEGGEQAETNPEAAPAPGTRFRDRDGDTWTVQTDGFLTCSGMSGVYTRAYAENDHGPLLLIP